MSVVEHRSAARTGSDLRRVDGPEKVTGRARYAFEHLPDDVAYGVLVTSTIAKGRVTRIDAAPILERPDVIAVITAANAPDLPGRDDDELAVLHPRRRLLRPDRRRGRRREPRGRHRSRGGPHGRVPAGRPRRHPAHRPPRDVHPEGRQPQLRHRLDHRRRRRRPRRRPGLDRRHVHHPQEHNNPMEPHATVAWWDGRRLTMHDSIQGSQWAREAAAATFGIDEADIHIVHPYVGGGFGAKGLVRPHAIATALAANVVGRPVKLAVTRRQMFSLTGYRTPTIQRLRLGATADGDLTAISHEVWEQTSTMREFAEQTAVATRHLYAAPNRRTTHRLVALDVPTPSWMRAPGETPGVFALECAMDELAVALDIDPVELRIRNEPDADPESGLPFSSRHLVDCLREGASRFGWDIRRRPGRRRTGRWLVGSGVASSIYPARAAPSTARATLRADGSWLIEIDAADIGTVRDSGLSAEVATGDDIGRQPARAGFSFGAQFAEVHVDVDTGEVRVPQMTGVFAAGRILNAITARSQLAGGMTMGLSMALHEGAVIDRATGDIINHDLAQYHIAANADIGTIDVAWIDEDDDTLGPAGAKGIGEVGIVGAAAAIANAVHDATGIRIRDLPITPDRLIAHH